MPAYEDVAAYIMGRISQRPQVGIICGSGLSGLSKNLKDQVVLKYEDIPGFPQPTVAGHQGELVFGTMDGINCVCMKGRFHFYEGYSMETVVLPVRVMRLLGVKMIIVTNAAGGLNPDYNVGDIVVVQDHLGLPILAGNNPLRGANDEQLGPRFPSISDTYDPVLQSIVVDNATSLGLQDSVRKNGTYCFVSGPSYESRSECKFLRLAGGDTVGMSTVPEIICAKHCGMKVVCLSLVTNKVSVNFDDLAATHQEVLEAVQTSGMNMERLVKSFVSEKSIGSYLAALPEFSFVPRPPSTTEPKLVTPAAASSSCCAKKDGNECNGCPCSSECPVIKVAILGLSIGLGIMAFQRFQK